MKTTAYYGHTGHTRDVRLTDEQRAAFLAPHGPHQSLADELRAELGATRLIVRCTGHLLAESEESGR